MELDRFTNLKIQEGVDARLLRDNPIFFTCVNRVLNKYAALEENILTDSQAEAREIGAKVKHYAMMRRAMIDAVQELNDILLEAENAQYEKDADDEY